MPYSGKSTLGLNLACCYFAVITGLVALPTVLWQSRTSSTGLRPLRTNPLVEIGRDAGGCTLAKRFKGACATVTPRPDKALGLRYARRESNPSSRGLAPRFAEDISPGEKMAGHAGIAPAR